MTLHSCIVGMAFIFVKIALGTTADTWQLLALRFTASALLPAVGIALGKIKLGVTRRDLLAILPLALFHPILYFLLQTIGLRLIPSSEAGILQATSPILILLLASLILKERTNTLQKVFICVSVSGVVLVSAMAGLSGGGSLLGAGAILLSSVSFACYNVMARRLARQYSMTTLTTVMTFYGFAFFLVVSVGDHIRRGALGSFFAPLATPSFLFCILYLGILSSFCTSLLSNYALARLEAARAGVFTNLSTVITIAAGAVFLGEPLRWYHLAAAVLIVAGVLGTNLSAKRQGDKAAGAEPVRQPEAGV